jgi:YVTN family beta-propeller protein
MKSTRSFFLSIFFIIASCGQMQVETPLDYQGDAARLLFYIHSTSDKPLDIEFTISWIGIEAENGNLVRVAEGPLEMSALDLVDRQIFIKEAFVEQGSYKGIKIGISNASIKRGAGRASLALPQPEGVVSLPFDTRSQVPSARRLLLFISNSASNYVSVIDTSLERVIGAVTVGEGPMGMALNSTKDSLYVVNSGSRTISIVDTAHFYVIDTIHLAAGLGPTEIAFMPDQDGSIDGKLYTINSISNDVTVVSTFTKRILRTITVGENPSAVAADTTRREVYVTNEGSNNVSIISAVDDSVIGTVTVDNRPTGLAIGEEKIYVFNEGSGTISKILPSSRTVEETVSLVEPPKRGLKAFNERLFVTSASTDTITFLDSQDVVSRTLEAGAAPLLLAADEERDRLYVTNNGGRTVTLFDPIRERRVKELTVGKSPYEAVLIER